MLFHVSEKADITLFHPRPSRVFPSLGPVVWAVSESHLPNYLLPRDCPRITFCATETTTAGDRKRFNIAGSERVIVVCSDWRQRVEDAILSVYEFPPESFTEQDASAGYWISREAVVPLSEKSITNPLAQIWKRGAEVRVVDRLIPLQDEVAASTLDFSIIRMRNASR